MNVLRDAVNWLTDMQEEHVADPVTYTRGKHSVPLTAILGKTVTRHQGDHGSYRTITDLDIIVRCADLVLDGHQTKPQAGDKITFEGTIYEVTAPNSGDDHVYVYTDPWKTRFRIHCKGGR